MKHTFTVTITDDEVTIEEESKPTKTKQPTCFGQAWTTCKDKFCPIWLACEVHSPCPMQPDTDKRKLEKARESLRMRLRSASQMVGLRLNQPLADNDADELHCLQVIDKLLFDVGMNASHLKG